jgi:hypothetical protein
METSMRKLLTFLIALSAIIFAVVSPVSAQGFNGGGFNVGLGPFASGAVAALRLPTFSPALLPHPWQSIPRTRPRTPIWSAALWPMASSPASMSGSGSGSSACGVGSFDALYIFATNTTVGSNATLAGLNLCGTSFTITVNGSPALTADQGWAAFASLTTDYLDTGFNPFTATSPNFTINSAHFAIWNNTNITGDAAMGTGNTTSFNHMYPQFSAGTFYSRLDDASASGPYTISNPQALLVGNRSSSSAVQAYGNTGSGFGSLSGPSTSTAGSAVNNATMQILRQNGATNSGSYQLGAASFGGSLSSGNVTSYYGRMKTYMTAVGVCGVITCP